MKSVEPNQPFEVTLGMPATKSAEAPWGLRRVRSRELSNMPRQTSVPLMTARDFEDRAFPTLETAWFGFNVKEGNGALNRALDKQGHTTHWARTVGGKQLELLRP